MCAMEKIFFILEVVNAFFLRAYGGDIDEEEQCLQIGQILTK